MILFASAITDTIATGSTGNSNPGGLTASGVLLCPAITAGLLFCLRVAALAALCAILFSGMFFHRSALFSALASSGGAFRYLFHVSAPCRARGGSVCLCSTRWGQVMPRTFSPLVGSLWGWHSRPHPRRGDDPRHPGSRVHGGGRLVPLADFAQPGGGQFLRRFG